MPLLHDQQNPKKMDLPAAKDQPLEYNADNSKQSEAPPLSLEKDFL